MNEIIIIISLILLNGIFAMSEIALISARKSSLNTDAKKGSKAAKLALKLANEPDRFLSTIQIGITLIGILTGIYSGAALTDDFSVILKNWGVSPLYASLIAQGLIVVAVTYLTLIFGELVPKRIGLSIAEKASKVVGDFIRNMDREMLCVVNFNSKLQPINFNVVSIGTVNQSLAVPRDILKSAILSNASNIMVLHNHPSGILSPSKDDIVTTARIIGACDMIGIPLLDHIIVGPNRDEFFSMKMKEVVKFNKSVNYEVSLEFLKFKEPNLNQLTEKNNKLAR